MTEFLNQCENFMLKEENLIRLSQVIDVKKEKPKDIYVIPKNTDTLFWCFYSYSHENEIWDQSRGFFTIAEEKLLKIQYVEKLRKNKDVLKCHKIASISHIENSLANESKIDIQTFFSLCLLENISVILFKDRTFVELLLEASKISSVFTVKWFGGHKFGWKVETINEINKLKETHYRIDNTEKPLRASSYYTVTDLLDICQKLKISELSKTSGKKKTKAELYESILQMMPY